LLEKVSQEQNRNAIARLDLPGGCAALRCTALLGWYMLRY
jgi:hypothetical protein